MCRLKRNYGRDVHCAFVLGLLAWMLTVYFELDKPDPNTNLDTDLRTENQAHQKAVTETQNEKRNPTTW
jgi:hypothetical protein